jgi:hypothetical protein
MPVFARHRLRLLPLPLLLFLLALSVASAFAATTGYTSTTVIPYGGGGYKYQVVAQSTGTGFEAPAFNDAAFSAGTAPFGTAGGCTLPAPIVTAWAPGTDILVRQSFTLPMGAKNLTVGIAIDNDVQVFLNGTDISGGLQTHENCATPDLAT